MARLKPVSRETSVASTRASSNGSCDALGSTLSNIIETPASTPGSERDPKPHDATPGSVRTAVIAQRRRSTRITVIKTPRTLSVSEISAPEPSASAVESKSRTVSGDTLVEGIDRPEKTLLNEGIRALDLDWNVGSLSAAPPKEQEEEKQEPLVRRHSSRLGGLARAASLMASKASSLGKRSREVMESGKDKLQALTGGTTRNLRPRVSAMTEDLEPASKKTKVDPMSAAKTVTVSPAPSAVPPAKKLIKKWLTNGLYIGQERDFDARLTESQNKRKRLSKSGRPSPKRRSLLPMPMFRGETLLENGRPFRLPFDVYSPAPSVYGQPKPSWNKTSSNRFVGDAAVEWKQHKPLPPSRCICTPETGCDESCQNKYMFYECDDTNCHLDMERCGNRQFADLKQRCKKGGAFGIGVDVVKTEQKGFGVRACRTFEANQIIMEYAGEIITQDECESRMRKEYRNNECYYLMTFDQNMIIDATTCGSSARFVNHSCEPNCKMEKWTVAGKPRMALFAGENGIMSGEELTYDYNFDPFSRRNVQICRCGTSSCRGFLGPRNRERESPSESTGVLAGAKRRLSQLLTGNPKVGRASSVLKKKRRVTIAGLPVQRAVTQKRVTSTSTGGSTLVEQQSLSASKRAKASSSLSSPAPSGRGIVKKTPLKNKTRRHTFDALTRATSNAKDQMSNKLRNSVRLRSSSRLRLAGDDGMGSETTGEEVRPATTSTVRSAATTLKNNVVSTVRGPRRAVAMKKYGVLGGNKSMRVILGDDE